MSRWKVVLARLKALRWKAIRDRLKALPRPAKIIGGLAALVGLILGVIELYDKLFPPPKPVARSVLLVVDSSATMRRDYGSGQTKLQAAKREIVRYVQNQPNVLVAIRFVGDICNEGYQSPTVEFGTNKAKEITRALDQVRPTKIADLAGAVGQGANDFLRYDRAGHATSPSMWIFFGGITDPCGGTGLANEIATELQGVKVNARFDFFVLRKTPAGRKELDRLLSKLREQGHTAFWLRPANPTQLHRAVEKVSQSENPSP
jgi:hypothetical protein